MFMSTLIKQLKTRFPVDKFFFHRSFSQEGEDMIYRSFFDTRKHYKGFYIDVGAHHPSRFSNTRYLYNKGWNGINIEPTPGTLPLFNIFRSRDINLNIGIAEEAGELPFYCFNDPALNSFSKEMSDDREANTRYFIKEIKKVKTMPLAEVLDKYVPPGKIIDLMTIDAEGLDMAVLQSNNWDKYVPLFIIIEITETIEQLTSTEVYGYLTKKNYELVAKTLRTAFFKLKHTETTP
jgi:FkbM family methyltransferase